MTRADLFKLFETDNLPAKLIAKPSKKMRKLMRLRRLMRFQWALRKIWAANVLWKRLEMKPKVDGLFA